MTEVRELIDLMAGGEIREEWRVCRGNVLSSSTWITKKEAEREVARLLTDYPDARLEEFSIERRYVMHGRWERPV